MLSFVALCASLMFSLVASQFNQSLDPNNVWLSAPGIPEKPVSEDPTVFSRNPVWQNNQQRGLQWRTTIPIIVRCVQEGRDTSRNIEVYRGPNNGTIWDGQINDTWLDTGNVFFFATFNLSAPERGVWFYSHYFNITRSTTQGNGSTGGTIVGSTPQAEGGGGGGSNGAAIGAGVGGGLGAVLIAGLIFGCWFLRRRKNKQKKEENLEAPIVSDVASGMPSPPPPGVHEKGDHYPFHGSFAPGGHGSSSPPQSPEPAPAYNKTHEASAHEVSAVEPVADRHELDASAERRG